MNIATPIVAPERAELESCIPAYRAEFRRKLANHGMSVEVIPRADFLRHHDRCDYPPFRGWTAGQGRILWGVGSDRLFQLPVRQLGPTDQARGSGADPKLVDRIDEDGLQVIRSCQPEIVVR